MSSPFWLVVCLALLSAAGAQTRENDLPVIAPSTTYPQINALVQTRNWKGLASLAADLLRQDASNPTLAYWLGVSQLQLHRPVDAVKAFRSAEKNGLDNALLHEGLGLAYHDLNQFTLFEQQMEKASSLDPQDPKPPYYMGLYRWTIRADAVGALTYFEQAIKLDPADWKSLYQAGNCEEQMGKLAAARKHYESAIALLDKNGASFGWPYQGMARLTLEEDPQVALDFALKAVRLEPEEPSNHSVLANVFLQLGRLADATREAEIAVAKNPNDSRTRYSLYKLYRQAGNPRAAAELERFEKLKALYDKD